MQPPLRRQQAAEGGTHGRVCGEPHPTAPHLDGRAQITGGIERLSHPTHGVLRASPSGTISRRAPPSRSLARRAAPPRAAPPRKSATLPSRGRARAIAASHATLRAPNG
eukprot:scaffold40507_cov35-Tisochrysis_lutea.AAC.4